MQDDIMRWAVHIADGCMRSDIERLGIDVEGEKAQYGLSDDVGRPVRRLHEATWMLQQAARYLIARELAELRLSADGLRVHLHLDSFARCSAELGGFGVT